jgi:hypothetical protein
MPLSREKLRTSILIQGKLLPARGGRTDSTLPVVMTRLTAKRKPPGERSTTHPSKGFPVRSPMVISTGRRLPLCRGAERLSPNGS